MPNSLMPAIEKKYSIFVQNLAPNNDAAGSILIPDDYCQGVRTGTNKYLTIGPVSV